MKKWIELFLSGTVGALNFLLFSLGLFTSFPAPVFADGSPPLRTLYAVGFDGSISVYDIGENHRLIRTIKTAPDVDDVRGLVASAQTGKLYVSFIAKGNRPKIYCLDIKTDQILWNKEIAAGVDRLAISPKGDFLYVPTNEASSKNNFISILNAADGSAFKTLTLAYNTHDTQYPLSGPLFQENKDPNGLGKILFEIDPVTLEYKKIGPYFGILGPFAVDSKSKYVVNNVSQVWGMQIADLTTGEIATAYFPDKPHWVGDPLPHGIGWTADEKEVWENGGYGNPFLYVWDMTHPMAPKVSRKISIKSPKGSHWLNFSIPTDYAYISPYKPRRDPTEIFDTKTYQSVGTIIPSEDLLEIDFQNNEVVQVGDQYGIGRASR